MEIKLNDILAFVQKAMDEHLKVTTFENGIIYAIDVINGDLMFSIRFNKNEISFNSSNGEIDYEKYPESDYHKLMVLYDKVTDYNRKRLIEDFTNFFKSNKVITINDLDNEND